MKSLNELHVQAIRLMCEADGNEARVQRIRSIWERYEANVHESQGESRKYLRSISGTGQLGQVLYLCLELDYTRIPREVYMR